MTHYTRHGQTVLTAAAETLLQMADSLNQTQDFDAAVNLILGTKGTMVITGIGKSGMSAKNLPPRLRPLARQVFLFTAPKLVMAI